MIRKKVLIIFPSPPNKNDASHYPYWHRVFDEASKKLDIQYVYETKTHPLTRFFTILQYVFHGYTNVYIHYSYWSVILCRVNKLFKPITIYYWDCEWYDQKPKNVQLDIALHWCDVLVTGSASIANQYIKIFNLTQPYTLNPKPFRVIPNWAEYQPTKKIDLSKDQVHILFVHHLSPRKGSRELPDIIRETVKSVPNAHFHIIGDGPSRVILEEAFALGESPASGIHTNEHVTFYGNLPLQQVYSYFASCNIFIMPSRSEGFPRVILEAMNYGLPIVATDVGNVRELVGAANQPFIVPPHNPQLFANSLIELVKNKSLQNKIIAENTLQAKQYSLDISKQAFINLFPSK